MDARGFGPDETLARNKQNVLIAESCQHLKDTASLRPYQNYHDAAMKLLGYHKKKPVQILADVDQEAADISETYDGAGRNLLMSSRHVWDEHLQRRAHACITTLATLHDNLSARTRSSAVSSTAQPRTNQTTANQSNATSNTVKKNRAVTVSTAESEAAKAGGQAQSQPGIQSRTYEDLKVEEWMRESRLQWETAILNEASQLDEEIAQVKYKRQCIEQDLANHKEAQEAKAKGLPPPAPRPYAPPPTTNQGPSTLPNPAAPPPQPAMHAPAQHTQHAAAAAAQPLHTAPHAHAPHLHGRPGQVRPAPATAYGGVRAAGAQPLRPNLSTAACTHASRGSAAHAYTHTRPAAAAPLGATPGGAGAPGAALSQSAAAAYASWQAAASGLPTTSAATIAEPTAGATAAAAPVSGAQASQAGATGQPAAYNMAFANRPPPTIPNEEAQRRARMLVDVHRAQQASSMNAARGMQAARGGARRPPAPQMGVARPVARPPGAAAPAPGRALEFPPAGEPMRRGPGRPPGRGRGATGRGPGRPKKPSHTVDLSSA